jgi:hypothetical protein
MDADPGQTFNYGVQGATDSLTIIVSRVPKVTLGSDGSAGTTGSDLLKITYYIDGDNGLTRQWTTAVSGDDPAAGSDPSSGGSAVLAGEVTGVQFEYFDGSAWSDEWDGTTLNPDGINPKGPPRAIKVTLTIRDPAAPEGTRTYSHVIALPATNGTPPDNSGTSTTTTTSSSSGGTSGP